MTFAPVVRGGSGSPMVCLHGFIDNLRTWDLVRPALEAAHDVLALALPGHAGGVELPEGAGTDYMLDALERAMDDAGVPRAHLVGNSLGGYLALGLAARGRGRSVVALAPAGGWAAGDGSSEVALQTLGMVYEQVKTVAAHADALVAQPAGRRQSTALITTHYEHIPAELLAHQIRAVAVTDGAPALIATARRDGWSVDAEAISCPVRMVWGTADQVLAWPTAAARYREQFPRADWVEMEGIGHCPQLDVPAETAQLILGFTGD
jgi:pimeloyl-ACP methyl ester carboxylesterase